MTSKSPEFKLNNTGIVIAAGGSGSRFGAANKLFMQLDGKPVFIHSIKSFSAICPLKNFVLTAPEKDIPLFKKTLSEYSMDLEIIPGGATRTLSVNNGLNVLPDGLEFVAVHDAARPLVSPEILFKCVDSAQIHGGAISARRVTDTIKQANAEQLIEKTVDRSLLWAVETPQVFRLSLLKKAYTKAIKSGLPFTDDASVMEYAGYKPALVDDCNINIKITYPSDIKLAEFLLKSTD